MMTTGPGGDVRDRYEYDAYGQAFEGSFRRINDLGYNGKRTDPTTGLIDYGFRDYAPKLGRFTTSDPIQAGLNWYAYVNNDPMNFTDPFGLCSESDKSNQLGFLAPLAAAATAVGEATVSTLAAVGLGAEAVVSLLITGDTVHVPTASSGSSNGTQSSQGTFSDAGASQGQPPATATGGNDAMGPPKVPGNVAASPANPFKGMSSGDLDKYFKDQGYVLKGTDPMNGKGSYIDPATGTKYYIDKGGSYRVPGQGLIVEPPHVDVETPGLPKVRLEL